MTTKNILSLKTQRKWFQLCKEVCEEVCKDSKCGEECKDNTNISNTSLISLYLENISQYHPLTITQSTLSLSKTLPFEEGILLLDKSIEAIREGNMYSGDFSIQIVHLEIQRALFRVEQGDFLGIEKTLYQLKKMVLPLRVYELYNLLGFKYFERTGNIDYSINYLVNYIELSKDRSLYDTLARATLLSPFFFNFMRVYSFEGFSSCALYSVYALVQDGDTKKVEERKDELIRLFGESHKTVIEKTYFIGLINLCFEEKSRRIPLEKIQKTLGIEEEDVHPFLLKAFGLGLLKGWVDEESKTLFFSTILPRTLPREELEKMKEKYGIWKKKVGEALRMI